MKAETLRLPTDGGVHLHVHRWLPDGDASLRAVVQISHGMVEHAARYERLAEALTATGLAVVAHSHRGHGHTASSPDELGFFADADGFQRVVDDVHVVRTWIDGEHAGTPVILLGHSFGAMVAQAYAAKHGGGLKALVLSGTTGIRGPMAEIGRLVVKIEGMRLGPRAKSEVLDKVFFGDFNRPFAPARTPFDWLSRDEAEVDKYIADPLSGYLMAVRGWLDVLDAIRATADRDAMARIPSDLPVYLFSGSADPVGGRTRQVQRLVDALRSVGMKNVDVRFYEGGRHELLNDTNRDEVTSDLLTWIDRVLGA
jgi:alpha-beta hydrolase superfamily lysophospholipase